MNYLRHALGALLVAWSTAYAAPFTITLTNSSTGTTTPWSTGLLTLSPVISLGQAPLPPPPSSRAANYASYTFLNSHCNTADTACPNGTCVDDGNATVLAQRRGLTLGTDAWVVPAIPNGGSQTISFDAPLGSRLSYVAWINNTGTFDDFIAMHPPGDVNTLSVPLFDGSNNPLTEIVFDLSGYDSNSTSATDGSGGTCAAECPPSTSPACYVAPGNATLGSSGSLPASPVRNVTAVSGNTQNRITWTNVSPHRGVIVARRAGSAITWVPTNGTAYTLGQRVRGNNATGTFIAFVDSGSTYANAFTDDSLTNGTTYYYKVFAFSGDYLYATGNVPTSSGIFSIPTPKTGTNPLWCYSVGSPSVQQPVTELGVGAFTANNTGSVTANRTQAGNSDGFERWRPVQLSGAVQSRFPVVPLQGKTGTYILTGDQSGRAYAINAQDGTVTWRANSGNPLTAGDIIQAQPGVQLYAFSNAAFTSWAQAAAPNGFGGATDVVFVATRLSGASNRVYALRSTNGSVLWTYNPGDLGMVNGGMFVDYVNNRLWVASRAGAAGQPTVRVLSTLTGQSVLTTAQQNALALGDIDYGLNRDFVSNQVYLINNAGTAYGLNMTTFAVAWSSAIGATTSYIWPLGNGFLASLNPGNSVRRYAMDGGTPVLQWSTAVTGPTGVTVDYGPTGSTNPTLQKVYVGSSQGTVRQLLLVDGGVEKTVTVSTSAVGTPTLDKTAGRLHIGTFDGRICAFPAPLP
ncbi:MAG: PQQ-binding-like beta-propeller repeat protein [Myxococcaceae bacterium]|nr:PQQ-binding-like beta-propeller repeat protein [Myxococcaceae bacterium]